MRQETGVPLASCTTLGLGGPAARLVTAENDEELLSALRSAGPRVLVLGGGSNLVVGDEGFDGTVVRVATRGVTFTRQAHGVAVTAAAGEQWDALVARCVADGLVGVECLGGIPGLVGATPVQNVGAYGQEVSDTFVAARVYDRRTDAVRVLSDLGFGYRTSRLKAEPDRWVVLDVSYRLSSEQPGPPVRYAELASWLGVAPGAVAPSAAVHAAVLELRRGKGMVLDASDVDTRSAGSFFTNPLLSPAERAELERRVERRGGPAAPSYEQRDGSWKVPAAWLIEQAGFRRGGFDGPVGISTKHTLALVHRGGGRTADLLRVARAIRDGVKECFGVTLVPEPTLVGVTL